MILDIYFDQHSGSDSTCFFESLVLVALKLSLVSFALWLSVMPGFPDSHGWYFSWLFLLSWFLYMWFSWVL